MMGYKPKATGAAVADVTVFCVVPASGGNPDFSKAPTIPANTVINSSVQGQSSFVTTDFIDFGTSGSASPTVYEVSAGTPQSYLLKKLFLLFQQKLKLLNLHLEDMKNFLRLLYKMKI